MLLVHTVRSHCTRAVPTGSLRSKKATRFPSRDNTGAVSTCVPLTPTCTAGSIKRALPPSRGTPTSAPWAEPGYADFA